MMVGNSSSGIVEAASFKIPVVNIGDRQKGRFRPGNVIDTGNSTEEIVTGIKKALSSEFVQSVSSVINPHDKYGDGKNSYRIKTRLKNMELTQEIIKKEFFDVNFEI